MSRAPSPLHGYNNNVRHKNRIFHIQTEDSGVKYGHIITHLFMDGGRILKSVKTGYQQHIGNEKLGDIVRELMKEQHKAMFVALREGQFDQVFDAPPTSQREGANGSAKGKESAKMPVAAASAPTTSTSGELTLDIDALERAAAVAETGRAKRTSDLPPPPANLFREHTATGRYKTIGETGDGASSGERRYGSTRPAAIFSAPDRTKPFGDALISEKTLDEVILSYLAEDLEALPAK